MVLQLKKQKLRAPSYSEICSNKSSKHEQQHLYDHPQQKLSLQPVKVETGHDDYSSSASAYQDLPGR